MAIEERGAPRESRLEALVRRARLALLWESAWPWLAAALAVVLLFLTVSWLGVWDALPPLGRMAGVALFALGIAAALAPLVRAAAPDRRAALNRVDRESGVAHRPATSLDDSLSGAGEDPLTRALWRAHQQRNAEEADRLRVGAPAPRLAARDPYALRFLLGLVAVAAFACAGSDRGDRVLAAFDWRSPAADVVPVRIDAWLAPPAYTGRPPIFLTARQGAKDEPAAEAAPGEIETIRAPQNSVIVVRAAGGTAEIAASGGAEPVESQEKQPEGVTERRFRLGGEAELKIAAAGAPDRVWRFAAIPDAPPAIKLAGAPELNARGSATIAYEVRDDYGVAAAEARFELKREPPKPHGRASGEDTAPTPAARPLYEAPRVALALPRAKAREGRAETPLDVMEHPFAGAEATMTLYARDEAGQEGKSQSLQIRLPARSFKKPLARALVEQRRILASDANAKPNVLQALRALMMFPEEFTPQAAVYLGLTTAYRRLENALSDDELRGAADYLWEIALRIEDGDLPDAERELRAAQEALRKALENNASEQEIQKLTQDLRQALEKFMREMAQQARQQPQSPPRDGQRGAQEVRPQDLRNMIDRMENLAKQGSRDAAKQALAELRNMLENLQNGQQQSDPNAQAQQERLDKLQDMIREQSKLRDKTFQQYRRNQQTDRNLRGQPQQRRKEQGEDGEQAMRELAEQQKRLRQQLDQMTKEMQQGQQQGQEGDEQQGQRQGQQQAPGQQPGQGEGEQPGSDALGQAGKSMGQAQGSLGEGQTGQALDQQQQALENMRKGAQAMAEAMDGEGQQPGQKGRQGQQRARNGEEGNGDDDPLGRPSRRRESDGQTTKVPGEIDAQRARRVLDELRRRLGDTDRSREELDYLERLLAP
ncbi:TIGR02302 family protein [Hansschlegelia sp.]|uniref:TIGR02302 family protein n=1 Tax=Hansschlegelia sp. TaxID=2041892 RepID=UPI002C9F31D0|nr:TIGR02302 family protein [Hansschlegelia sp.]HVI29629.1 TIGR02302 family protein [Hansschlegelia sp.]